MTAESPAGRNQICVPPCGAIRDVIRSVWYAIESITRLRTFRVFRVFEWCYCVAETPSPLTSEICYASRRLLLGLFDFSVQMITHSLGHLGVPLETHFAACEGSARPWLQGCVTLLLWTVLDIPASRLTRTQRAELVLLLLSKGANMEALGDVNEDSGQVCGPCGFLAVHHTVVPSYFPCNIMNICRKRLKN